MGAEEECGVRGDGGIREKVERGKRTEERRRKRTEKITKIESKIKQREQQN